jgi:hypothetical protein
VPSPARVTARMLRGLLLSILGAWIGALSFFVGLARAAFEVVPDPAAAAHVVGRMLAPLEFGGSGAGLVVAALGGVLGRGRASVALGLAVAATCLVNQVGIVPLLSGIHPGDLSAGAGLRFSHLHTLSMTLLGATFLGVLALWGLHLRAEWVEAGAVPRPGADGEPAP